MTADYIPESDALARNWLLNIARLLEERGDVYRVTPDVVAAVRESVDGFVEAFSRAAEPMTRTRVAVAEKRTHRADAERVVRRVAQQIRADDAVGDADKINIGVRPIKRTRVRAVRVPDETPYLMVTWTSSGGHRIKVSKEATDDLHRRRKPAGAVALQLFRHVGEANASHGADETVIRPAIVEQCQYVGTFTTAIFNVPRYPWADAGKVVTYVGRWISRSGQEGPFGMPVAMRIAA